jgi:hypothetical protein
MAASFLTRSYEKLPFVLRSAEADRQIKDRQKKIVAGLSRDAEAEPIATKRRVL